MIVAIDGPAGSGKSTIAREIARRHGFEKLDTGAMYRAVTFAALSRGIDLDDAAAVSNLAQTVHIAFLPRQGSPTLVMVDSDDVTSEIRTPEVDAGVSKVSAYPQVREAMLSPQRAVAREHDVVAEGRDIGTVVFPDADVKVFLTADPLERARRRVLQRHEGEEIDEDVYAQEVTDTLNSLVRRDKLDSSRDVAPLRAADDAVTIDSTSHSIDEVVDMISSLIESRRP